MTSMTPASTALPDGTRRRASVAPCLPLATERLALQPLDVTAVRITDGPWARWQAANRTTTIPHGLHWLEKDGVIDNFRRLIGESDAPERRGWVFCDSDLYKVLEGIAWDLSLSPNEEWNERVAEATALLARTQDDDGYLNTVVQAGLEERFGNLPRGHELYCAGHLIQAAVAYARVTGDERLMDVARPFADYLVTQFVGGGRNDTDGHPEIESALVELYRYTGEASYLTLARQLIDVRGYGVLGTGLFGSTYFQDDVPVREQQSTVGHSVRALYLLAGVVDVYLETGEEALLKTAERQWASMVGQKTYLTGAVGSRFEGEAFGDPYELPPDLIYGETCAAIASLMLSWRLLIATGESKYADLIERILYNVFSASTSLERDGFFYVNPVQRRRARPAAPAGGKPLRTDAPGTRAEWYDVACCPPNIMRTIGSLTAYVSTATDDGVQLHQFLPGTIAAETAAGAVSLTVATDYPRSGIVAVTISKTPPAPWSLALRIPRWSRGATLTVGGERIDANPDTKGYTVVRRTWAVGDLVVLDLPLPVRVTVPNPAVDAVRGSAAIERGPVVYCLEKPLDERARLAGESVDLTAVEIRTEGVLSAEYAPDVLGGSVIVHVDAQERSGSGWSAIGWAEVGEVTPPTSRNLTLALVPYGLWANRGPSEMRVWLPIAFDSPTLPHGRS